MIEQFDSIHAFIQVFLFDRRHGRQQGDQLSDRQLQKQFKIHLRLIERAKFPHHFQVGEGIRKGVKVCVLLNQFLNPVIDGLQFIPEAHFENFCEQNGTGAGAQIFF